MFQLSSRRYANEWASVLLNFSFVLYIFQNHHMPQHHQQDCVNAFCHLSLFLKCSLPISCLCIFVCATIEDNFYFFFQVDGRSTKTHQHETSGRKIRSGKFSFFVIGLSCKWLKKMHFQKTWNLFLGIVHLFMLFSITRQHIKSRTPPQPWPRTF